MTTDDTVSAHHHAGDGCITAIESAQKALAEQIQRIEDRLTALAELLPQQPEQAGRGTTLPVATARPTAEAPATVGGIPAWPHRHHRRFGAPIAFGFTAAGQEAGDG